MLKIIYRTMLKELFFAFFLSLAFLNSILMMEKLLRLSRLLSGVGASLTDMARIIFYLQPQLMMLTIPMSLLLSTLLVYGRMNLDSEIVILKASGMDFRRIAFPVMLLGLFCFLASIAVSFYLGPQSSIKLRKEITKIITDRSTLAIEEGTFNTSFRDIVIIVKGRKSSGSLEKIFIYDSRDKKAPKVLMAKEGRIFMQEGGGSIGLYLQDGYINITKGGNITELFFKSYKMTLNLDSDSPAAKKIEFTPIELLRKAAEAGNHKKKTALYLEFHRRLSLPTVCLMLVLLGPPLALMAGRAGRLGGLALGLAVFTTYYMLLIYGENLALAGEIPHYVGAWMPLVILGTFSAFMFKRVSSR
ncbi:MAG: LptF/LptG family permease [Nitrospirota bacterium]|nr:LptF/LptG family permease [Nitrospirota bacterium]